MINSDGTGHTLGLLVFHFTVLKRIGFYDAF